MNSIWNYLGILTNSPFFLFFFFVYRFSSLILIEHFLHIFPNKILREYDYQTYNWKCELWSFCCCGLLCFIFQGSCFCFVFPFFLSQPLSFIVFPQSTKQLVLKSCSRQAQNTLAIPAETRTTGWFSTTAFSKASFSLFPYFFFLTLFVSQLTLPLQLQLVTTMISNPLYHLNATFRSNLDN